MYCDPTTKITHAVWIENKGADFVLAYTKIYYNRTKSPVVYLETAHRARLSHLIGEGDGKYLLIAYDAKRTQGDNNVCAGGVSTGCYEIYFRESFDGGNTWTPAVMIEHDNPKDVVDRRGPRLNYVEEIGRVIITYQANGPMAYAIRKDKTKPFSKEIIFPFSKTTAYQSIVHTTDDKKNPIVHFFYVNWTYPEEEMMYTKSLDGGDTWAKPRRIAFYKHKSTNDAFFRPYAATNHDIELHSIYLTFILDNKPHMIWTHNNGDSFTQPYLTHNAAGIDPRIQLCKGVKGGNPKVYQLYPITGLEKNSHYVFGSLDTKTGLYKDEETPFAGFEENWDHLLDCYEDNGKMVIPALLENERNKKSQILLSFNDKKATSES
jgi:hypothetical protein